MTLYFFIDIPADVMLITSKSMLIVRLGVGFFIVMLMLPVAVKC